MKTAYIFGGQGTQHPGMAAAFDNTYGLPDIARQATGIDVYDLCLNGTQEQLNRPLHAQLCTLFMDLLAYRQAQANPEYGEPAAVAGHSLGEYAALTAAGVLDTYDAFALVKHRALCMEDCIGEGTGMAAVLRLPPQTVEAYCDEIDGVYTANYNSPKQTVISGTVAALEQFETRAKDGGGKVMRLNVAGAFHTPYMKPAADACAQHLRAATFKPARVPIAFNTTGTTIDDPDYSEILTQQIHSPVRWVQCMYTLRDLGVEAVIECSPKSILSSMFKDYDDAAIKAWRKG